MNTTVRDIPRRRRYWLLVAIAAAFTAGIAMHEPIPQDASYQIVIGIGVGRAVRWGSRNPQAAAATTTAPAEKPKVVAASTAPTPEEALSVGGLLVALVVVFSIAAAAPIMAGAENIIGMLIIAFGLYEAWKINKRVDMTITGPFSVAPVTAPRPE